MDTERIAEQISLGKTFLGLEFGSTRIKAVLTDFHHLPIASGAFDWENSLIDGVWTYGMDEILRGMRETFSSLKKDVLEKYGVPLKKTGAMGVSAMMHGYLVFDRNGKLLTPFRTWRNTMTAKAAAELSSLFSFNIPERWSIAHLYQSILNNEAHVGQIAYMTTLSGYIHYLLTGQKVLGVGDASGMFPIDSETGKYNQKMLQRFDKKIAHKGYAWKTEAILPRVLQAGERAGTLTAVGAKLLDFTGEFEAGVPFCPPEGDAGTGMTATNSVRVETGNVSAGTSIFAMIVLEKNPSSYYPEIDMVTTPDGKPVAMVHCNNCTGDLDGWMRLFGEAVDLFCPNVKKADLYDKILCTALDGDADCGGLMSYNTLSGESITGLSSGNPLFLRSQNSKFNLSNFIKTQLLSALCTLRIGMDILYREGVTMYAIAGHGGYFKTRQTGTKFMAAALNTPVKIMETAGEGGPWGMALLAAYMLNKKEGQSLADYLDSIVFADTKTEEILPSESDVEEFNHFLARYKNCLDLEKAAAGKNFESKTL